MSTFGVEDLGRLCLDMDALTAMPDEVLDGMLDAGGEVFIPAIRHSAKTMLKGPYSDDAVADSVVKGKKSKSASGRKMSINFKGEQHGEPIARIAYVNEYGKKNQPGRPFLLVAAEESADDVVLSEERVYDQYLQSKNL